MGRVVSLPSVWLFGCLFCFISWVDSFSASRPEMLLFTLGGRRTVGMLGHLAVLARFLLGESCSRWVPVTACSLRGLSGGVFCAIELIVG